MIALAIILAVLAAIALIPVGVRAQYDAQGLLLRVMAGALGLQLYPAKEKKRSARRMAHKQKRAARKKLRQQARQDKPPKPKKAKKAKQEAAPPAKKKFSLGDIWPLLQLAKDLLGDMRRKLVVRQLYLRVRFGGEDMARSAISYGRAWAVIGAVMPTLETLFRIQDRDVEAEFDPTKAQMELEARLDFRMRIGSLMALGCKALFRFLKILIKQKKGGAET